jgi:hypothetical protein
MNCTATHQAWIYSTKQEYNLSDHKVHVSRIAETVDYPAGMTPIEVLADVRDQFVDGDMSAWEFEFFLDWYLEKHREL